jgi:hypothetical protein
MNYSQQVDSQIQAAAASKYGSAAVNVVRQEIHKRSNPMDQGVWYLLFIGGSLVGRRRTKAELLAMVEAKGVQAAG